MALLCAACVTKGRYDTDVGRLEAENAKLGKRVENLERSNEALDRERVRLTDELEDLQQARATLQRDVAKLQKTKELLTDHLRKREEEVAELSKLSSTYEGLVSDLQSEVTAGQIQIEQLREGIRLNLQQEILFPSGSVQLDPRGQQVLGKVASRLREIEHRIEVQGHSDDVPVSRSLARRFPTNWELAAARASRVVRLLQDEGVDPNYLIAISYGPFAPVATNDTPEGRARNRRIEIRLVPIEAPEEVLGSGDAPRAPGPDGAARPAPARAGGAPADES